jgi:hypothetical protein
MGHGETVPAPPPTDEQIALAHGARRDPDLQRALCNPAENPQAAAYFVFNYCFTQDEERGGAIVPLPNPRARRFALDFLEALDAPRVEPHNLHDEKCRRMIHTWIACFYNLWALMWVPGYIGLLISKSQDHVDDGGKNSLPFSMFGRMQFAYDRLPAHVARPVSFTWMNAQCPDNNAYLVGRAPSKDAGRGGGYVRVFVDECAHVDWMEQIHMAVDPACKLGKVYMSTVNGPRGVFARIKKERTPGWRFFECDWWHDPAKTVNIRPTADGPERDRYGQYISPWFQAATQSLRDDEIAREYLRRYDRGAQGLVFKEFNISRHIAAKALQFDPSLEAPRMGVDYGATGFGAAVFGQLAGPWSLRCVLDYELEGAGGAKEHARAMIARLRQGGYTGDLADVLVVGGPDTNVSQTGSGQTIAGYFRAEGLTRIRECTVRGPGSVDRGITVVCVSFREDRVVISPACRHLTSRLGEYRWPTDRFSGAVKATHPIHNDASHIMDAFRYLVADCFPSEMAATVWRGEERQQQRVEAWGKMDREVLRPDEGVARPVMVFPRKF